MTPRPYKYLIVFTIVFSIFVSSGYSEIIPTGIQSKLPGETKNIPYEPANYSAGTNQAELLNASITERQENPQLNIAGSRESKPSGTGNYAESELLVQFKPNTSKDKVNGVHSSIGSHIIKDYKNKGIDGLQLVALPPGLSVPEAMVRYKANSEVQFAEPNYIRNISEMPSLIPNDPGFLDNSQWALHNTGQDGGTPDADIDAPEAWIFTTGSKDVVVAVIDTGVDYNHVDLAANIWNNTDEIPGNGLDDDNNGYPDDIRGWDFCNNDSDPMDDNNHGTHCAGIIGATGNNGWGIAGVNWNVRILPLKCLDSDGKGTDSDIIEALQYAKNMSAQITSNSWSGPDYNPVLEDTINESGMLCVFAAGNYDGMDPQYPACYPSENIIAVAATNHHDNLAYFSNYHPTMVDLAAPGDLILSTIPGGNYSDQYSGTSMATPHVAGAAALIAGKCPDYTPLQVKEVILNNVDQVASLEGKVLTGGRLNLYKALEAVTPDDTYCINGTKYLGTTSTGLPGWSITVNNSTFTQTVQTGSDGSWQVCGLYNGTYDACETLQSGWRNLTPVCTSVTIAGANRTAIDFRNEPDTDNNLTTKIGVYQNGTWYLDRDGDGSWGSGDAAYGFGAPGWTAVVGDWNR